MLMSQVYKGFSLGAVLIFAAAKTQASQVVQSLKPVERDVIDMPMAYQKIARDYGIPPEVFFSVMLTESSKQIELENGRKKVIPWPWTLNVELRSYYFKSKEEAKIALKQFLAADNKRIAVGLGQIYLPSHGHLFQDKTVLLEPGLNLQYAAHLLAENFKWTLDQGKPNWWVAVGRYHTPSRLDLAIPYR